MIRRLTEIKCDRCGRQSIFDTTDNAIALLRAMREGWSLIEDKHLCPRCKDDNKADNISV